QWSDDVGGRCYSYGKGDISHSGYSGQCGWCRGLLFRVGPGPTEFFLDRTRSESETTRYSGPSFPRSASHEPTGKGGYAISRVDDRYRSCRPGNALARSLRLIRSLSADGGRVEATEINC